MAMRVIHKPTFFSLLYFGVLVLCWISPAFAQAQDHTFSITLRDQDNNYVQGAAVSLTIGGESYTKHSGMDGAVSFTTSGTGSYSISVAKSGYQFNPTSGEIGAENENPVHEIVGQAPTITLSGTVKSNGGAVLSTPIVMLNGTQQLSIDGETGRFSTNVVHGTEYTLTISDSDWFFTNPETHGIVHGDIDFTFVGFPK